MDRVKIRLPLSSPDDLRRAVLGLWGVELAYRASCATHATQLAIAWRAYIAEHPVIIVRASRGCGKTLLAAAIGLTTAHLLGVEVTILGGSLEQSVRVHEHMRRMWQHPTAPRDALVGEPTRRSTVFCHGGAIHALAASSRSVRGPHPVRLILDEVDEIDPDLIDAALGQPQSRRGIRSGVLAVSTEHYTDGGMRHLREHARARGWPVIEYCWRDCLHPGGWLTPEAVERMRASVPESVWRIEYELGEPVSTDAAFDPALIREITESRPVAMDGGLAVLEPPQPGAHYVCGIDWARKQDTTVIVVLRADEEPHRVVAYRRLKRVGWARQCEIASDIAGRYDAVVYHDATGLGDVVHGMLDAIARPVVLTPKLRGEIISEYTRAIEQRRVMLPPIDELLRDHRTCSWDDLWGSGHLPDGVCAMALAVWGARAASDPGITI